jgi:uncharacterized protein (DUF2141 family)
MSPYFKVMKISAVLLVFFGLSNMLYAQSQLEIVVKNIKNDKGNVRVGIFNNKETFLEKALYGKVVQASTGELTVLFENIPPGKYAVSIIHDENKNDELDSGMFGIPKEGFGFANDAMGSFGPPGFEKASITVETGKRTITITLRYL